MKVVNVFLRKVVAIVSKENRLKRDHCEHNEEKCKVITITVSFFEGLSSFGAFCLLRYEVYCSGSR